MEVTDVRIKLASGENDNLLAYCSITFDDSFVVSDLRIVRNSDGVFVSMPSRKVMFKCPACRGKNHSLARFCNDCGKSLDGIATNNNMDKRLFVDMAHPINPECRKQIVDAVLAAYNDECARQERN